MTQRARSDNTLWLDASNGLAGDMFCAALLDAGADLDQLRRELDALELPGLSLQVRTVHRGPFRALHFSVLRDGAPADAQGWHHHSHDHAPADAPADAPAHAPVHHHDHAPVDPPQHHHHHHHDGDHHHDHGHAIDGPPPQGSWRAIRGLIEHADLPERARARALAVFHALAVAEARAHGMAVEDVQFHEVGAIDSIADIVGACLLLEQLDVETLVCTPLPLGGGAVQTDHGLLGVPTPATLELLTGWPCVQDGRTGELVTPTGAALVATLGEPGPMPSMTPTATGMGAGTWNPTGWPNVVRAVVGHVATHDTPDRVHVLECQLDDLSPEHLPGVITRLLDAGALDAFARPITMKKGRMGWLLTALARPGAQHALAEQILEHTTSFGVRHTTAARTVLDRRHETVQTAYGPVRIKLGSLRGRLLQASPEHADCAARAQESGVAERRVYAAALSAWEGEWPASQ
jgi:uncharacterized protein (TIGR00299 family) protein